MHFYWFRHGIPRAGSIVFVKIMWKWDTFSIYTYQSTDAIRKRHLYIHISRLMQSENGISIYISVDLCNQKTASLYTYQSTYAIRKRHIIAVLHISKPWKWTKKKKKWKKGVGCEKGGCCVLSTSTCAHSHIHSIDMCRPWITKYTNLVFLVATYTLITRRWCN